jgi:hypothetical protein
VLIQAFTAQPEAPACTTASAFGWAVNAKPLKVSPGLLVVLGDVGFRHSGHQFTNDVVDIKTFRLSLKVGRDSVSKDGDRHFANVPN